MKSAWYFLVVLILASVVSTPAQYIQSIQSPVVASLPVTLPPALQEKILSAEVLSQLARKTADVQAHGVTPANAAMTACVYASAPPSPELLSSLEALGVRVAKGSWIPPLANHPLGFFIARIPTGRLTDVLAIADVRKMDTAERLSQPLNNLAAIAVRADLAWASAWTGTGVKVAVLDSGFDNRMPTTELPVPIAVRNYASYPTSVDTNVRNTVSPHGTHVVGTVLGRGGWSSSNTINGGGSYKGMAPGADLVFLRIGDSVSSSATSAAMVAAIAAAADSFSVKEISMSYGGWDTYHDGSDANCQAVDYAYGKGVACFIAAGNSGAEGHHASGSANAHDTSAYMQITITNAGVNIAYIAQNLVWRDAGVHNPLTLLYYNSAKTLLTTVTKSAGTTSQRGTESEVSYYNFYAPSGNSIYYIRVLNSSAVAQPFHLYFWPLLGSLQSNVVYAVPDQNATIGSPAFADHAFAVGAYDTRGSWIASDNNSHAYADAYASADIAYFSSRGPRIDGLQKPNITAPGKSIISLRDRDVLTTVDPAWIDNDGVSGGSANYYVMQGTSMATPVVAGSAALVFQHSPLATPQQVYDALTQNAIVDGFTGAVPNATWGYGKLDVNASIANIPLPVELSSFTANATADVVTLAWKTASETNSYGFEIQKKPVFHMVGKGTLSVTPVQQWSAVGFASGSGSSNAPRVYSFIDREKDPGAFVYRLKQIDKDGKFEYSAEITVEQTNVPIMYALDQNYPNPFNPETKIRFSIGSEEAVHMAVYDLLGRRVAELVNERMHSGRYAVVWNGAGAASGVYFYRLDAGSYSSVKKLILQK